MNTASIAKLQRTTILIFPQFIGLFDIYTNQIRPLIDVHTLKIEQSLAYSKPTLFIKNEEKWLLVNNFELYHLLKSPHIDQKILKQEMLISDINKEQIKFGIPFYELIGIIARHKKRLDLKLIYKYLNELLTKETNQQLFGKNIFPITIFCQLINITEQTYHKRPSENAS